MGPLQTVGELQDLLQCVLVLLHVLNDLFKGVLASLLTQRSCDVEEEREGGKLDKQHQS